MYRTISGSHLKATNVALADILANSVAVLLILIVLMVSVRKQQAEVQFEQSVDINVMMARELTNSLVLDALPNSRPAYLHDYTSCAIAHDCNPNLYPIIELHDHYVAVHNPYFRLSANQLIQQDNLLDIYLRGLSGDELSHIRVDIYGIGLFYLAISTLREYGAALNHWHFLGETTAPPVRDDSALPDNQILAQLLDKGEKSLLQESGEQDLAETLTQDLPEGINLADPLALQGLESDQLLPLTPQGQPNSDNQTSNPLLNELLEELSRRRNDNNQGQTIAENNGMPFRLRIPNYTPPSNTQPLQLNLNQDQLETVLLQFIFAALNDASQRLYFSPEHLSRLFSSMIHSNNTGSSTVSPTVIRDLKQILKSIQTTTNPALEVTLLPSKRANANPVTLRVRPNSAITALQLQNGDLLPSQVDMLRSSNVSIDLLLRAYPFVYKGERLALEENLLALILPQSLRPQNTLWRPIAIVSPDLQNITFGFIEAAYQGGMLELPLEVNQIRANNTTLQTAFAVPQSRNLWQLALSYGIAIVLFGFLLWLFLRWHINSPRKHAINSSTEKTASV